MQIRKLQINLLILFGLAMAVTITFALTGARNTQQDHKNNHLTLESQERLLLLENLIRALFEAESSLRAFAASGSGLYLEEHLLQRREITSLGHTLEETSFPSPVQARRVRSLQELVAQRTALMDTLANIRNTQGEDAAARHIASQEGKRVMDKIRDEVNFLAAEERAGLKTRAALTEAHNRQFIFLVIGGPLFNLLLLIGAFVIIRREMKRSARLVGKLRTASEEITRINQLSSSLQSCESRDEAAEVLRHYMARLFPGTIGGLYLMRPSRNMLQLSATWGAESELLSDPIKPHDCWSLRSGRPQVTVIDGEEMRCAHIHEGYSACLCVPLMAQSDIIGMLHLELNDDSLLPDIHQLAALLSTHLSAALAGIILREALHQQSIRDPLTDLYNRRYLEESLERELLRAQRERSAVSVIMLDIDHFKQFNDTHGHRAGDALLKDFAQCLRNHVRGEDILCRYGGEEFLIVLPGTSLQQCYERAETLRANLVTLKPEFQGRFLPPVTASLGIAVYPDHASSWESLVHLADAALYHAKRNGRNRVSSADDNDALVQEE